MARHRRNPLTEHGPPPAGGRPKPVERPRPNTLFELRPVVEYEYLWRDVCALMERHLLSLEEYANLSMPGLDLSQLKEIQDRVNTLVKKVEENNE